MTRTLHKKKSRIFSKIAYLRVARLTVAVLLVEVSFAGVVLASTTDGATASEIPE